jgi:nuclear receptor interaction protein
VDEVLVPYLLQLASDEPIVNIDTNPFEANRERQLFENGSAAVLGFAAAVRKPFADLSSAAHKIATQDRRTACRFWAQGVARGILLNATRELPYVDVDRAFGGRGDASRAAMEDEALLELLYPYNEEDEALLESRYPHDEGDETGEDDENEENEENDENDDNDDNDDNDENDENDESDESDESAETSQSNSSSGLDEAFAPFDRRRQKCGIEADVPCSKPLRSYSGHCNTRTVKDVNYFGMFVFLKPPPFQINPIERRRRRRRRIRRGR